jgi:thiamine biosynthesis protein ThiS
MTHSVDSASVDSTSADAASRDAAGAGGCRIVCNGQPRQTAAGTTVAALLTELGLEPRHVAVEVNLELVPRARHAERVLCEGDKLEIVTLVGGG